MTDQSKLSVEEWCTRFEHSLRESLAMLKACKIGDVSEPVNADEEKRFTATIELLSMWCDEMLELMK